MQQISRRKVLFGLGAVPLALAGCGGGGGSAAPVVTPFAAKPVVDNLADAIITQTYRNLNSAATALIAAVQALVSAPTAAAMDAAQGAWRAARVPWETSEGFLFGPVDALGIDPSIDSWPLNTPDLLAFLTANPNATQADIENASDDLRGFHAMEFLLFGDGVVDNDKPVSELTVAEANYLVALAQAFQARTQTLETSWTTSYNGGAPYATTLKSPGSGSTYAGYGAVIEELINGIAGIADEIGNAKIAEPLGTSIATADTSKEESQYSWNSLTDFHNNMQSVVNIYTGKLGFNWSTDAVSVSLNGLYAFVAYHDTTLATRVLSEIIAAQQKIALIKGDGIDTTTAITGAAKPFRTQILDTNGRALANEAIAACNTLLATLTGDVLPLLADTTFA
jgi:putative iron-regulated protein